MFSETIEIRRTEDFLKYFNLQLVGLRFGEAAERDHEEIELLFGAFVQHLVVYFEEEGWVVVGGEVVEGLEGDGFGAEVVEVEVGVDILVDEVDDCWDFGVPQLVQLEGSHSLSYQGHSVLGATPPSTLADWRKRGM